MVGGSTLVTIMHFSMAQTGTSFSGIISKDTTWTQANSPYTLTGNVLVNATLIIQAGTTVNLGSYYMEVNNTLQAIGTSSTPITFNGASGAQIIFTQYSTNWTKGANNGCIVEDAVLASTEILCESSPNISYNTFNNTGIYVGCEENEVAPLILNNVFNNCGVGVGYEQVFGWTQPIISNNIFLGGGIGLGEVAPEGNISAIVLNNVISGASTGVDIESGGGVGVQVVEGNLIVGNGYGMEISEGIYARGNNEQMIIPISPIVENNTITDNDYGILFSYALNSTLLNNNIYNNGNHNLELTDAAPSNVNATYNWWGTTDTQTINQTIYDFKNDFKLGTVSFVPFLDSPNIQAPTFVNATAGAGGSIVPSGIVRLNYGGSQAFTISPNAGYHIANVLVNGASVGAVSSYTVQNVNGATTISVTFAANPTSTSNPSPTPSSPSPSAIPTASPTASPSSTPTTVPEFPSLWVILTVFIAVSLSIAVLVMGRKSKIIQSSDRAREKS